MDNEYLQLSPAESMYFGPIREESWSEYQDRKAATIEPVEVTVALPAEEPPKKKRWAGRKPLDEAGKAASAVKAEMRRQRIQQERADRRADRAAETKRKQELVEAQRVRLAEAKQAQEHDVARANRQPSEEPAMDKPLYRILYTTGEGTRVIKVQEKTELHIKAGKDIDEAVSRFVNRKQVTF